MVLTAKRRSFLTLDVELLDGVKDLGIKVSAVAEAALKKTLWPVPGMRHSSSKTPRPLPHKWLGTSAMGTRWPRS